MGCHCSSSSILYYFCFFLLLGFLTCSCPKADGIEEATHHVVQVQSLLPTDVCTPSKELGPSQLQVVHRHGPCSPLRGNNNSAEKKKKKKKNTNTNTHKRTQLQILKEDQIRVDWLQSKTTRKSKPKPNSSLAAAAAATKIPARIGSSLGSANFIVTLGFGTPKISQTVEFDTGSDVTWIQCQPCVTSCYSQQDRLFNPTKSSTYLNISCASPYCTALYTSGCDGPSCLYAVHYADDSDTQGFFAQDTLTLSPSDVIPGFRFGCGQQNVNFTGRTAGLLGLGRGQQASLVTQTASKYGGVFSYCLPSTSSSTGYLSLGSGAPASNLQFTPMLSYPEGAAASYYFLELVAISVAGQRLAIPPTLFSTAGVVLDSGTVITRLPPTAYSALRVAFRKQMTQYPAAPAMSILDTCYDFSKYATMTTPTVALNFKGADLTLDSSGILYVASSTQACLAFAANDNDAEIVIVGNTQQRKISVVYDVTKKLIGFGTAPGC